MCTLTVIPCGTGVRMVMNRDELESRARGEPPTVHSLPGGMAAVMPRDPESGGTWIAANSAGVILAIMNGNPDPAPPAPRGGRVVSRGSIIPEVARMETAGGAIEQVRRRALDMFMPFRLVAADGASVMSLVWDGHAPMVDQVRPGPVCFVSSGLGDHRVAPRLALFEEWIREHGATARAQDRFHEHAWPDRPEISVRMVRPGARTVSVTRVETDAEGAIEMRYADSNSEVIVTIGPRMLEPGRTG